jgi:hypothetical protein
MISKSIQIQVQRWARAGAPAPTRPKKEAGAEQKA